jgi:hypothetical protein
LTAALAIFEVTAGGFIATMDLVMSEKKVLSSKTDMTDMTYVVDMPGMVFTMPVQRLLGSVGFFAVWTLIALRFCLGMLTGRYLFHASWAVVQLLNLHRAIDPRRIMQSVLSSCSTLPHVANVAGEVGG